jgi:hypothetical protein
MLCQLTVRGGNHTKCGGFTGFEPERKQNVVVWVVFFLEFFRYSAIKIHRQAWEVQSETIKSFHTILSATTWDRLPREAVDLCLNIS